MTVLMLRGRRASAGRSGAGEGALAQRVTLTQNNVVDRRSCPAADRSTVSAVSSSLWLEVEEAAGDWRRVPGLKGIEIPAGS